MHEREAIARGVPLSPVRLESMLRGRTMEFSGRLAAFPPGDLVQWARNDRRTGALVLRRTTREKRVFFRKGEIVGCVSDDPGEFYGQYLLLNGHLTEGELIRALTHCGREGKRLGAALRELRILQPATIEKTLRAHIQDLVCDVFLWDRGVFFFETGEQPQEDLAPEPLDPVGVALEGARWLDELGRIRKVLVHDQIVLGRGRSSPPPDLGALEKWILGKVNGRRSLAQLHRATGGSYFRFLSAALQLCVLEVLDLVQVPEYAQTATREINLAELMREQAQDEHPFSAQGPDGVSLEVLKSMVPVWLGEALALDAKDSFYARCDGSRRLAQLLTAAAADELDQLYVGLRRGLLALLPAPLDELDTLADRRQIPVERRWWQRVFQKTSAG